MGILSELGRAYARTYLNTVDGYGELYSGKSMVNGVKAMQDLHLDVTRAVNTGNQKLGQVVLNVKNSGRIAPSQK